MRVVIATALLLLLLLQLIPCVSGEDPTGESSPGGRCVVLRNGSVSVDGLVPVNGSYVCDASSQDDPTQASVQLHVTGAVQSLSTSIVPTTFLPNGTLVTYRGLNVSFNCSSSPTPPSQTLSWGFLGAGPGNKSLASGSGAWLGFWIPDIQPSAMGRYWCTSRSSHSSQGSERITQLLVYYVPVHHPDCLWELVPDPSEVQFNCSWPGAYPEPTLRWAEVHTGPDTTAQDHLYVVGQADSLVVTLNRSRLFDGQILKCIAEHPALMPQETKSCLLTLKSPFPEGKPLVTALEMSDVTLTCTESRSVPPANTTWRRGVDQEEIVPGSKYLVSASGPELRLTIRNVSKADEGVYFCRSENPLAVRELEVLLTVTASVALTGAIIGIFIAALIVGTGVIAAKLVYSSRDRICLGNGFGRMEEERGDVISLVDSEDEVFHDTVPRLPPLTNHTTNAQIHPVPGGGDEDVQPTEPGPEPQEDILEFEDPLQLIKL
ncbi:unnamed protein product [Merluccius merluccius]